MLLGEIRDHETAQIAIEAALTGHLVLSTLHTNDAPSAVNRLIEMGIEPFLVGSALDCVLAQRLARRLCPKCKEAYVPDPRDAGRLPLALAARRAARPSFAPSAARPARRPATRAGWRCTRSCRWTRRSNGSPSSRASADTIGSAARAARHDDAARRRAEQGAAGADLDRGDPARRRLIKLRLIRNCRWPAPASRAGSPASPAPLRQRLSRRRPARPGRYGARASRSTRSA